MHLRSALALLLFALPLAIAQAPALDVEGATPRDLGGVHVATWAGNATAGRALLPGEDVDVWFAAWSSNLSANATARVVHLNVSQDAPFAWTTNGTTLRLLPGDAWRTTSLPATVVSSAVPGPTTARVTVEVHDETPNGTVPVLQGVYEAFTIEIGVPPAPPAGAPVLWVAAGAAALVVGGAGAYALHRRSVRRRMNQAPRRSQVLREMALEKELERAKAPEQKAAIQQEIRQQEQVRVKRREVQILEAKRMDVVKSIDLLRKRHEAGALSKLQFDTMVGKKEAELRRLDAEISEMESADTRDGSSAAS